MNALANNFIFWLALIMALISLYILPTLIAVIRGTESLGGIVVLNVLPTGVGWLAALIMALMLPRKEELQALPSAFYAAPGNDPATCTGDACYHLQILPPPISRSSAESCSAPCAWP
jgi:hypothetical protein